MDFLQIVVLAVIQGFTEFLPISSSAHLILFPRLFGWTDQGLAFDVAVHLGTLGAVVWYFRTDLTGMSRDWLGSLRLRRSVGDSLLAWAVLLGTIPVGLAGLLFKGFVETELRSPMVIAWDLPISKSWIATQQTMFCKGCKPISFLRFFSFSSISILIFSGSSWSN
jgi:undecaprenyl-diphosphatase